jgi:hypothetical protein
VSSVSNSLYFLTLPLVSVMRVIFKKNTVIPHSVSLVHDGSVNVYVCMYVCMYVYMYVVTGHFVPEVLRQYDGLIFLTLQEDITILSQNFGHQSSSDLAPHPGRMDTL